MIEQVDAGGGAIPPGWYDLHPDAAPQLRPSH